MPNFLLYLPDRQHTALREQSRLAGVSMAEYVRRSLDQSLFSGSLCSLMISGGFASGTVVMVRVG